MKIYRENTCGCEKKQTQTSGPCVMHWCAETLQNGNYRKAVWTGEYLQTTLMCIPACGDVGLEYHDDTDQLLLVAEGCCKVCMGKTKDNLCYQKTAKVGDAQYCKHRQMPVKTFFGLRAAPSPGEYLTAHKSRRGLRINKRHK